jgi:hypothetical protein
MNADTGEPKRPQRTNLLLRGLIDEMIGQLRELQRHAGPLPAAERARLEADLERIMSRVRTEAFKGS